uniref:NADP-dependent oxidoreductase domain-containing protein n=1 Tax=Megaselia scalaris TaxID=36166 RepID=T1GUZ2_MEGSC
MSFPETYVDGFHDREAVIQMEYRSFGKTNMKVSKLAIGGATFSNLFGPLDEQEGIDTLHTALKNGINYIDTAPYYGDVNLKIGRYKATDYDTMFDYSAKKTRESIDLSLKLLGVDYIDVITIHDIEYVPTLDMILNEALPTLEKLKKEGKVRNIGVSAYPMGILNSQKNNSKNLKEITVTVY